MQYGAPGKAGKVLLQSIGQRFQKPFGAQTGPSKPDSTLAKAVALAQGKTHKIVRNVGQAHRALDTEAVKGITLPTASMILMKPSKPMRPTEAVFRVPLTMNKLQVKDYLEEIYRVGVMRVQTAVYLGKPKLNKYGFYYKRPDWKKAVVRLAEPFTAPKFVNTPAVKPKPKAAAAPEPVEAL